MHIKNYIGLKEKNQKKKFCYCAKSTNKNSITALASAKTCCNKNLNSIFELEVLFWSLLRDSLYVKKFFKYVSLWTWYNEVICYEWRKTFNLILIHTHMVDFWFDKV